MKKKFNLVGNTFTHLTGGNKGYSVHGKESKYIEWVQSGGDGTFYIDNTINEGVNDKRSGPKYLWLLESKFIKPGLVESIIENRELVENTFDIIFTHDQRLLALGDKFKWVPAQGFWIKEPKIYEKSKMISMISSNKRMCEGHLKRLEWIERIGDQVDLYGRGFNEIELKEDGLCDYMFSVAIENDASDTYFTEKLTDCFVMGTVPVYYGSRKVIEKYFDPRGVVFLEDDPDLITLTKEKYEELMPFIEKNFKLAQRLPIAEDYIYENYLKK
jgi:hypothetical protein